MAPGTTQIYDKEENSHNYTRYFNEINLKNLQYVLEEIK